MSMVPNPSANGMCLRDWFAGQALVGFQTFIRGGWAGEMPPEMADNVAANCYAIADAMLRYRAGTAKPLDIVGKWPGNETDEQVAKALEELS